MPLPPDFRELACSECAGSTPLDFDFSMAFQPIVDVDSGQVFAYEALVWGLDNEPAGVILEKVNDSNRYRFDQCCRVKAIKLDMALIRNIHQDRMRQAIVKGTLQTCIDLGTRVVAEGVETREELATLYGFGIRLFQGYYFARPGFETLPEVPAALFDLAALQQR